MHVDIICHTQMKLSTALDTCAKVLHLLFQMLVWIPLIGQRAAESPFWESLHLKKKLEDVFVTAAVWRAEEFQTTVEPLQCFLPSLGESCSKKTGFVDHCVNRHVLATVGATFHQVQAGRAKLDVQHSLINFLLLLFWSQSTPGNFVAL